MIDTSWRGSGLILVIDDDPAVLQVARMILERFGFSVHSAQSGRAALEFFRANHEQVRCVLLDLTMPDWSGAETFRQLRRVAPEAKVILTSGYAESQAAGEFTARDLAAFLQKPYQVQTLIEAVRRVLEG
jgi:DNA-binding NtrC family response regulator